MEWNPKEPGFFIELAYATRRAESIHTAHVVLDASDGLASDGRDDPVQPCLLRRLSNLIIDNFTALSAPSGQSESGADTFPGSFLPLADRSSRINPRGERKRP